MRRSFHTALVIAAMALSSEGHGQVLTPSRMRLDSLPRPVAASLPGQMPANGVPIHIDRGHYTIRPGQEPAYIIKDATTRVLAMVPPGDTSSQGLGHPLWLLDLLEPGMIASINVVRDSALAPVLGRGFENGLIIVALTPSGTEAWRRAARQTQKSP